MAGKMRVRASIKNGVTEVKALMSHPMETGLRKDTDGNPIPAHHITDVEVKLNDKVVLTAYWGGSVSQNPFLSFEINGGAPGDKLSIMWKDNKGESQTEEVTLK